MGEDTLSGVTVPAFIFAFQSPCGDYMGEDSLVGRKQLWFFPRFNPLAGITWVKTTTVASFLFPALILVSIPLRGLHG